ncbi:MAG TPA: hypothetical protein VD905_16065, partial [Flavobacteriales bacterium]|nr:hypothetical protein [Flavobacteriales bacterium]
MSINDKNIDQWLFDYYEGNLSPAEVRQLESFLKKNPHYYEDASAWKDSFVEESVPAFDTTVLMKDVASKADRKRYALASVLLLFLGSFSAIYLTTTGHSGNGTDKNNGGRSLTNRVVSNNAYTTHHATNSRINNVSHAATYSGNAQALNTNNLNKTSNVNITSSNLNFNNPVQTNTFDYNVASNRGRVAGHNQRANQSGNQLVNNTNSWSNNLINLHIYNSLSNIYSSTAVTNYQQSPYAAPNQNPTSIILVTRNTHTKMESATLAENTPEQNNAQALLNEGAIPATAVPNYLVSDDPSGPLTLNGIRPFELPTNEMVESTCEVGEDINLTLEDKATVANVRENPTGLSPDGFPVKIMGEPVKTDEIISKDKKDIKPENGIRFSNLKNVILLQGLNSEFEMGSSFISQHFQTDGYLAANLRTVSGTGETFTNYLAGYSATLRKSRTTFNGYGHFVNTNLYRNAGVGLQAAKNIRLDRYNFIVPSVGISFEQYLFTPQPLAWNCIPPYTPKTYFGSELTGKADYLKYKSASHVNVSAGMLYHAKKYYVALSFNGLAQPKFKYQGENAFKTNTATNTANVQLVAGTDFISHKYKELSMSPQVIIEMRNMEPIATGGSVVRYKSWAAGAGVSTKGSVNT